MNIGMVLDGSYPSDIRVRKEAEELAKENNVFVLCTKSENELDFEEVNNVKIDRCIKYKSIVHKGILDVLNSINFNHLLFSKQVPLFIERNRIDVIHVHDLPLAKTGYIAAKKYGIRTVLDLHENYPAALTTWFSWRKNPIIRLKNKIFFSYNHWLKYEKEVVKKFDFLITVVDEMSERLYEHHGIEKKKIIVVPNAEKKEFANNFMNNKVNYFEDSFRDKFIISYVGGFGPHRGLQTAIEAMPQVIKAIPNARLVLIGPANNDVMQFLREKIRKLKLKNVVILKGKEPFKNVVRIMNNSHINIIPHISNEQTESAVPHKFYQILLSKQPILVSDCAPMKRLIEENNIGNVFKAEDENSFADSVIRIYNNYNEAQEKAKRGFDLSFNGHLNWESQSKSLMELYRNLD